MVERIVPLLSYLIMTRITTTTIATTTPPIPPAMGSMLLVWGSGGENCTTTILPDKDKGHYDHYRHYYAINTSCYWINVTCLRLWWRGLYHYYPTWWKKWSLPPLSPLLRHQYLLLWDQCYLSEAMMERFVLLLSYLIKRTMITTTTIATTTPPIPPAIE